MDCRNARSLTHHYLAKGKWGTVSRKEIIAVVVAFVSLVIGVVVAVVFVIDGNKEQIVGAPAPKDEKPETFFLSKQDHYIAFIGNVQEYGAVADTILENFSDLAEDLVPSDIYTEAAYWLFNTDEIPVKYENHILPRFTLATVYVANAGPQWVSSTNWMSPRDVCDWEGISCDPSGGITEGKFVPAARMNIFGCIHFLMSLIDRVPPSPVDLTAKGLSGELHSAWALLSECGSIILSDNALRGPIPGSVFGSMVKLTYLYLNENQLTGTIPVSLKATESLGTYTKHPSWQ